MIKLDNDGLAKFPNGIALTALILHQFPNVPRAFRIRMTFPQSIPVPLVEATDISEKTWDAVVTAWSTVFDAGLLRDRVLRTVLSKLPAARVSA